MEREIAWNAYSEEDLKELEQVSADYKAYLDAGKTERECVAEAIRRAEKAGFSDMKKIIAGGGQLKPGDRVYSDCMGKALMLFVIGAEPVENGFNIIGAHVDSPRMD